MANVVISSHKINVYLRCRMVEPRYLILHIQWPCINCVKRYVRTEIEYRYYRFDFIKCPHAAWITGTYLYVVTVIRIKFWKYFRACNECAFDWNDIMFYKKFTNLSPPILLMLWICSAASVFRRFKKKKGFAKFIWSNFIESCK